MHFVGQVVIKRPDSGNFPGPGRGVQAVIGIAAVLMLNAVTAEIGHVAVDIRQRHAGHEIQIHIHDVDLIQRFAGELRVTDLFHVAEEIPQVQEVFVDRALGMRFDSLVVREKIPQNLRRFGAVIRHIEQEVYDQAQPSIQPVQIAGNQSARACFLKKAV